MESPFKICCNGGYLTGSDRPIANEDDPAVTEEELSEGEPRSCGEIYCRDCRKKVRTWDNVRFVASFTAIWIYPPAPGALEREAEAVERRYDSDDPDFDLTEDRGNRAYSCRCFRLDVTYPEALEGSTLSHSWHCYGHTR